MTRQSTNAEKRLPRKYRDLLGYQLIVLVVVFAYFAGVGPVLYFVFRAYPDPSNVPSGFQRVLRITFAPCELLSEHWEPYDRYASWFVDKGESAGWRIVESENRERNASDN